MKIIGMPGDVNTSAAPSVERLRASQLSARPGQIFSGIRPSLTPSRSVTSSCDSV